MNATQHPVTGARYSTASRSGVTIQVDTPIVGVNEFLDHCLDLFAEDWAFRNCVENQFTQITLLQPDTAPVKLIGFPRQCRERLPVLLKEIGRAPRDVQRQQKAEKREVQLNQLQVWNLLSLYGFGNACSITRAFLPEFHPLTGKLPANQRDFVPQRNEIGAPIGAWQVDFTCDLYNKTEGVDLEKQLISRLPEGLFLDSYCRKQGCIIWLALKCWM